VGVGEVETGPWVVRVGVDEVGWVVRRVVGSEQGLGGFPVLHWAGAHHEAVCGGFCLSPLVLTSKGPF
jgi:hypothetical protein